MQFRLEPDGDAVWLSIGLDRSAAAELIGALAQFLSAQQPQLALPAVDGSEHNAAASPVAGTTPPPPATDATTHLAGRTVEVLDQIIGPAWREGLPPLRLTKYGSGTRVTFAVAGAPLERLIEHIRAALPEAEPRVRQQLSMDRDRLRVALLDRQELDG